MKNRHNNQRHYQQHNRGQDRPRDDQGRFESETDWYRQQHQNTSSSGRGNYSGQQTGNRNFGQPRNASGQFEPGGSHQGQQYMGGGRHMSSGEGQWDKPRNQYGQFLPSGQQRSFHEGDWQRRPSDGRDREYRENYGGSPQSSDSSMYPRRDFGAYYSEVEDYGDIEYDEPRSSTSFGGYRGQPNYGNGGTQQTGYGNGRMQRANHGSSQMGGEYGPHVGRGPKGYRRSDERIQEDVSEALTQHGDIDAGGIEVRVENGEVVLTGVVTDRNDKRMAEDIAEQCSGVQDVRNEIRVQRETESGSQTQMASRGKSATAASSGKTAEAKTA